MDANTLWIAPLLLLPGVALLVLSTSTRFGQLHDEFRRQQDEGHEQPLRLLRRRARLFRNALVSLYLSVSLLAVSSVIGTIASLWADSAAWLRPALWIAQSMTVLGVVSVAFAAGLLIRESSILLSVLEHGQSKTSEP